MKLTDEQERLLKSVIDHFDLEDKSVRERQIRVWRKLKLLWDGFSQVWYSEVAHDWRVWDEEQRGDNQQDYYDKPINVFRAYLESIIAALSTSIPPIKCFPDDAEDPLDIATAKAGDKIAELISRHNDVALLWLHTLFIYCTEGMVACYNYTHEDEKFGTYKEEKYKDTEEEHSIFTCPSCGATIRETQVDLEAREDEFDPNITELCLECEQEVTPTVTTDKVIVSRLVGVFNKPKARQCLEVYGGLYVKVANYAKKQADTPYLMFSYETDYTLARERYDKIRDKIGPGTGGTYEPYERYGRTNPQYSGAFPINSVTVRNTWLRPAAFQVLTKVECDELKKLFPHGAKVVMIDRELAEYVDEDLDDHWTLTHNPLSDYLYHDPIGLLLTSIQEITNDLVSLTLQTIEHGIPQTFANPSVLNFDAYRQMESIPGAIYPTNRIPGGTGIKDAFYEVKTATLSGEVLPFANKIQEYGQLVSGALPSLFGGEMTTGGGTASEYSMSRSQASQRLQSTWKMLTIWWKTIYGKVIPAYIKSVKEDEKIVKRDKFGNFANILIRKAELEGKIGSIEIEANENLPMSWSQRKDIILKLMEANNPQVMAMIAQPENLGLIYEALGITDFFVPGEDDRNRQYDEIKQLLNSEPIPQPPDPMMAQQAMDGGMPPPPEQELPSVEMDADLDNHAIHFEICRKWAMSEAGEQAKTDNSGGYKNVLLHALQHKQLIPPAPMDGGAAPLASPKENTQTPITGDQNVKSQ
jgi:hypothetical protein